MMLYFQVAALYKMAGVRARKKRQATPYYKLIGLLARNPTDRELLNVACIVVPITEYRLPSAGDY